MKIWHLITFALAVVATACVANAQPLPRFEEGTARPAVEGGSAQGVIRFWRTQTAPQDQP